MKYKTAPFDLEKAKQGHLLVSGYKQFYKFFKITEGPLYILAFKIVNNPFVTHYRTIEGKYFSSGVFSKYDLQLCIEIKENSEEIWY